MNARFLFWTLGALPLVAQLPSPNAAGVSAGHEHFVVRDVEAATRFWTTLGGVPAELGQIKMIKFPGVFLLFRKGEPKGGSEGSTVPYVGFRVKDLKASIAKWKAAGLEPVPVVTPTGAPRIVIENRVYMMAPDDVRVEIGEDPALTVPIASDVLSINVPSAVEAEAWYEKWFGAKLVKNRKVTVGEIPGSHLRFSETIDSVAGTKGRSLDHIGFEVKNLEDLCKKLEAAGIKLDVPYRKPANIALSVAFVTDPWGTSIELNEGFSAVP